MRKLGALIIIPSAAQAFYFLEQRGLGVEGLSVTVGWKVLLYLNIESQPRLC